MICNELLINRLPDIKRLAYWIKNRTGMEEDEAAQELILRLMESKVQITEANISKVLVGNSMNIIRQYVKQKNKETVLIDKLKRERCKQIDDSVLIALEQLKRMNREEQITILRYMAGYIGREEREKGYRIERVRKTVKRCLVN